MSLFLTNCQHSIQKRLFYYGSILGLMVSSRKHIYFSLDDDLHKKFKTFCNETNITMKIRMTDYIKKLVAKYEGGSNLDTFIDPTFIPTPKLDVPFEDGCEWLKTQNEMILHELSGRFYSLHIMCKAMEDCANPKSFNMDYVTAWRKYK